MAVDTVSAPESPLSQTGPAREDTTAHRRDVLDRLPLVALGVAVGVFIIAVGYARGRADQPWAAPLYWVGEAIVFLVPAVVVLNRRRVTMIEAGGISVIFALATFVIKECYSPLQFTFTDEFQHLPTIQSILSTHHLFHANPSLIVSPYYPGLEIVTSAVVSVSHLSTFLSAAIVLGVAHLIATVGLFYLVLEIIPNPRIAAIAVFIYATGPDYQFFTSYFAYESLGLPLAILSLLALVKMVKSPVARPALLWGCVCVVFGFATTVTHHVSSYALFALELCVIGSQIVSASRLHRRRTYVSLAVALGAFVLVWGLAVASTTYSYLQVGFSKLLLHGQTFTKPSASILPGAGRPVLIDKLASPVAPVFDRGVSYAWALLLAALLALGLWELWRKRRQSPPLVLAMAVASPIVFIAFIILIVSPGGGEAATRLFSFALIPGSLVGALAVDSLIDALGRAGKHRYSIPFRTTRLYSLTALLVLGAVAVSWPPFYARIPGPYLVGGGSRAIDQYNYTAAQWAGAYLSPGNPVAADTSNSQLMASLGRQSAANGYVTSLLLIGTRITPGMAKAMRAEHLQFVVADHRITTAVPVGDNAVFDDDAFAGHYGRPIPAAALDKFNAIAGISRIFDDGPIVIYDLAGSAYSSRTGRR